MRCDKQLLEVVQKHNIQVAKIEIEIANQLRTQLRKYLNQERDKTLCMVQSPQAWMWIKDYVQAGESILFFALRDTPSMFKVSNGTDLDIIITNTTRHPFYVTSDNGNFLLEYDEYDHLVAYKDAIPWPKKYAYDHNIPLKCYTEN